MEAKLSKARESVVTVRMSLEEAQTVAAAAAGINILQGLREALTEALRSAAE